jgi:uncharacterized membrane protein
VHTQIQRLAILAILSLFNKAIIVSETPAHDLLCLLKGKLVYVLDYFTNPVEYPMTHYLYTSLTIIFPLSLNGNFGIYSFKEVAEHLSVLAEGLHALGAGALFLATLAVN